MESDPRVHFLVGVNKQELLCVFLYRTTSLSFVGAFTRQRLIQTLPIDTASIMGKTPWRQLETSKWDEFCAL